MSNIFDAAAFQRASFTIAIGFFSSLSHWNSMSFHKIWQQGACNYCILRDPYSVVCTKPEKCPAPGMVLAPGHIAPLIHLWCLQPPCSFAIDKPNYWYHVPAPVEFLSGIDGSSTLHIIKYVIEVPEVFHNNPSNSWQAFHLLVSLSTVWAFHSDIVDDDFSDWSQVSV